MDRAPRPAVLALLLIVLLPGRAAALHPCGLIREDPRTVPWLVRDTVVPNPPRRLSVSADLSGQMPPVGDQGSQGSCTAWAVGYYQKTHYEWLEFHWNLDQTGHQFSPAFIYNQANGGEDEGASFGRAYALVSDQGCATMADCPYSANDFTTWPSESAFARAIPHRGGSSHYFEMHDTLGINLAKMRLDSGLTTVIGISIYSNFDNIDSFNYTYCVADTYGGDRGAHAVTIVGYNDTMTTHDGTGAFKLVNSWGTDWGQAGYWWMSYVAARNAAMSDQTGYYQDDLIGYTPTMLGRVKISHAARDRIGIQLGVGSTASPLWFRNFRAWRFPKTDRPFPGNNLVFDLTDGEPYITDGTTDSVFVRAIDDKSDSKTGTIGYFAGHHLAWNSVGVSNDPPVDIPDYNVGVFARATIHQPHDAGVVSILAPVDTVDSGASASPQAVVKNYGGDAATFPVFFRIGSYADSQNVTNLAAGDSALVSFALWTATERGANVTRCSTALGDDTYHPNDTASGVVTVRVRDAACVAIVSPRDTVEPGLRVTPRAVVKNAGTNAETFDTRFAIGADYADTVSVTLAAGGSRIVDYADWMASTPGTYPTACATVLGQDMYPLNDTVHDSVTVADYTGVAERSGPPLVLALERPVPEPMAKKASVRFSLPHQTRAGVSVYSATGALVRVLSGPRPLGPGVYSLSWDGRDEQGRRLDKGVYFWRLETDAATLTRKTIKID